MTIIEKWWIYLSLKTKPITRVEIKR
jgi:hypothetical protein